MFNIEQNYGDNLLEVLSRTHVGQRMFVWMNIECSAFETIWAGVYEDLNI